MNRKFRLLLGLMSLVIGGGLVYASSNDLFTASADAISSSSKGTVLIVVFLVVGVALIAAGVMLSLFVLAANSEE